MSLYYFVFFFRLSRSTFGTVLQIFKMINSHTSVPRTGISEHDFNAEYLLNGSKYWIEIKYLTWRLWTNIITLDFRNFDIFHHFLQFS